MSNHKHISQEEFTKLHQQILEVLPHEGYRIRQLVDSMFIKALDGFTLFEEGYNAGRMDCISQTNMSVEEMRRRYEAACRRNAIKAGL